MMHIRPLMLCSEQAIQSSMNQLQNLKRDRISRTARSQLGERRAWRTRDSDFSRNRRVNRNGRLHGCCHIGNPTARLTLDTVETCCAYYSAGTATPYSPSGPLRSAAVAVAAADETAVAVAASSATTPRLLTYRGIKNIRIARRWPPPPPYSWRVAGRGSRFRVAELPRVEPRACVYSIEPKERKQKPMRDSHSGKPVNTFVSSCFSFTPTLGSRDASTCARERTRDRANEHTKANGRNRRNGTKQGKTTHLGVASLAPARHLAAVFSNEARPTSRRRHKRCFCNWI